MSDTPDNRPRKTSVIITAPTTTKNIRRRNVRNTPDSESGSITYSDQVGMARRRCHANIRSLSRKQSQLRLRNISSRQQKKYKHPSNLPNITSTSTSRSHSLSSSASSSESEAENEQKKDQQHKPLPSFAPSESLSMNSMDRETTNNYANRIHFTSDWYKVVVTHQGKDNIPEPDEETREVCNDILRVQQLRDEWIYKPSANKYIGCQLPYEDINRNVSTLVNETKIDYNLSDSTDIKSRECSLKFERGVMHIYDKVLKSELFAKKTFEEYLNALNDILSIVGNGPVKTFCYRRLQILKARFDLHLWLNDTAESGEIKSVPHRDFYNVRKIDNHVHHSACMSQVLYYTFIFVSEKRVV